MRNLTWFLLAARAILVAVAWTLINSGLNMQSNPAKASLPPRGLMDLSEAQ